MANSGSDYPRLIDSRAGLEAFWQERDKRRYAMPAPAQSEAELGKTCAAAAKADYPPPAQSEAELGKTCGAAFKPRYAVVPTMGALHGGHLSLVRRARELADIVVVSVFLNPLQFGVGEDFGDYPRRLREDCEKLRGLADVVFAPSAEMMYGRGQSVYIELPPLARELCGASRPHFFRGVAVVVCKIFNLVGADVAVFGQKDYQQAVLIRRMVGNLNMPVAVEVCPTVREADGLAMSSRNAYLTAGERAVAAELYGALRRAAAALRGGVAVAAAVAAAAAEITAAGMAVDYVEVRRADDLAVVEEGGSGALVVLAAAQLGRARLIDNILV